MFEHLLSASLALATQQTKQSPLLEEETPAPPLLPGRPLQAAGPETPRLVPAAARWRSAPAYGPPLEVAERRRDPRRERQRIPGTAGTAGCVTLGLTCLEMS